MPTVRAYHRPTSLSEAISLLSRPDTAVLAGGTTVNGPGPAAAEVVDLQALGLNEIEPGATTRIGAMVRLQDMVDHPDTPPILRELAHREAPNTIRNAATVGGTVGARDPESELLAGLLAHAAIVTIARADGSDDVALEDLLAGDVQLGGGIITHISIEAHGPAAAERAGRTPADRPIVAAVARLTADGSIRTAFTGVAATPVLASPSDLADPPADFRGSSRYRRELATVLGRRVVDRLRRDA